MAVPKAGNGMDGHTGSRALGLGFPLARLSPFGRNIFTLTDEGEAQGRLSLSCICQATLLKERSLACIVALHKDQIMSSIFQECVPKPDGRQANVRILRYPCGRPTVGLWHGLSYWRL